MFNSETNFRIDFSNFQKEEKLKTKYSEQDIIEDNLRQEKSILNTNDTLEGNSEEERETTSKRKSSTNSTSTTKVDVMELSWSTLEKKSSSNIGNIGSDLYSSINSNPLSSSLSVQNKNMYSKSEIFNENSLSNLTNYYFLDTEKYLRSLFPERNNYSKSKNYIKKNDYFNKNTKDFSEKGKMLLPVSSLNTNLTNQNMKVNNSKLNIDKSLVSDNSTSFYSSSSLPIVNNTNKTKGKEKFEVIPMNKIGCFTFIGNEFNCPVTPVISHPQGFKFFTFPQEIINKNTKINTNINSITKVKKERTKNIEKDTIGDKKENNFVKEYFKKENESKKNIFGEEKINNLPPSSYNNSTISTNYFNNVNMNVNNNFQKNQNQKSYYNKLEIKFKKPFIEREGDWVCNYCKNLNFSFRLKCNRCTLQKDFLSFNEVNFNNNNNVKISRIQQNSFHYNQFHPNKFTNPNLNMNMNSYYINNGKKFRNDY